MAQIIELGAAPDIDAMDADVLRDYLAEIRERIARLDEDEPEDMASEAYDEWSEQHGTKSQTLRPFCCQSVHEIAAVGQASMASCTALRFSSAVSSA